MEVAAASGGHGGDGRDDSDLAVLGGVEEGQAEAATALRLGAS